MKKTFSLLSLMFVCLLGFSLASCSDNNDDEPISATQLPKEAQTFISTYYPNAQVAGVMRDTDHGTTEYDVTMTNGHKLSFDAAGSWTEVDAPTGTRIPTGFIPQPIVEYVGQNYPAEGFNEISRTKNGYDVELTNDLDLIFDSAGQFVRLDR